MLIGKINDKHKQKLLVTLKDVKGTKLIDFRVHQTGQDGELDRHPFRGFHYRRSSGAGHRAAEGGQKEACRAFVMQRPETLDKAGSFLTKSRARSIIKK